MDPGLFGLIPYSAPAQSQCGDDEELAYVESGLSATDWTILVGLSAVGAFIGGALVSDLDDETRFAATQIGASAGPALASPRTVAWGCVPRKLDPVQ